ncbi:DUF4331 domain-containing protein [Vitiosangium sp. GDMCC 1.1324]|uniref:DUF4331 domain-containing protein n=1 Tax=Vitiosangium sp. (strain GDMCC 1.1324) TaxID=2138576 RepID=UPI000D3A8EEE|nr:DUF4331 domain-containing protein [Vitiosangium sp. GDMCC 1.1324]PTL80945.1 hypothetical protein DAT35_26820 [Vitiosangium sp. GDMCC 1.1324]
MTRVPLFRRLALVLMLAAANGALASSHREAPLISNDPAADGTDLFAWKQGSNLVLVADYYPLNRPAGGPNFYLFDDNVTYQIKIDTDGNGTPDVAYKFRFKTEIVRSQLPTVKKEDGLNAYKDSILFAFAGVKSATDPNILRRQTYTLTKVTYHGDDQVSETIVRNAPVGLPNIGKLTTPGYPQDDHYSTTSLDPITASAVKTGEGAFSRYKAFAGQRDDPFFVDLGRVFDFLALDSGEPEDYLAGFNVLSLVIEVPLSEFGSNTNLGIWTTASRPKVTVRRNDGTVEGKDGWVQVSRLGNPLINEVVVPMKFKDRFNASRPEDDLEDDVLVAIVTTPELPVLLQARHFIADVPPPPRLDLVKLFVRGSGEMLHIDTTKESAFPNGRRLPDDVTDLALQVMGGLLYTNSDGGTLRPDGGTWASQVTGLGDGVPANDRPFLDVFPYLAPPHSGNP